MGLQEGVSEFRILNRQDKFLRLFRIHRGNAEGARIERKRMEAKHRAGDDAESPQSPGDKLGKIVTGDVFHHLAAAARERAVGESNGDANDQVAQSAKTQTERTAVVGGEHATHGGFFRPQRIKRQPLAMLGERFLQSLNGAAGLDTYGKIGPGVLDDFGHSRR